MLDAPRRDTASRERAAAVFKLFARAKFKHFPQLHRTSLPGIAIFAAGTGALIAAQRWMGLPFGGRLSSPSSGENLLLLGLMLLLALMSSFMGSRWRRPSWSLLALAMLPFVGALARERWSADRRGSAFPLCQAASAGSIRFFGAKKSGRWRRFEKSFFATSIPSLMVPALFALLACSLASRPPGSPERAVAIGCEMYAAMACSVLCFLAERFNRRGSFSETRLVPLWPLGILPFGLNLLAVVALMERQLPEVSVGSPLFFDRQSLPNFKWEFLSNRLPRARKGNSWKSARTQQAHSVLRIKVVFLAAQAMTVGILFPWRFFAGWLTEGLVMLGVFLCFALFFQATHEAPRREEFQARPRRIFGWWMLAAAAITFFGFAVGSALGRGESEMAALHLVGAGLAVSPIAAVLRALLSGKLNSTHREVPWLVVLLAAGALGYAAVLYPNLRDPLAQFLIGGGIAAFLLDLPVGFFQRHLFLDPFDIRDLWQRELPAAIRLRLVLLLAFLLIPFGGLGNAMLAVAVSRRDQLLRQWWETRGEKT